MKIILVQLILILLFTNGESSKLTDEASLISNSEFKYQVQTSVVWWRTDPEEVTAFLSKYQGSVKTIYVDALIANETITMQQAVLFITTYDEFLYIVTKMDTNILIPCKVITILTGLETDSVVLNSITETASEYDITDLIIMNYDGAKYAVEMHTYFPYSDGNGCDNTSAVKMDSKNGQWFPRKFNNFHGCEVTLLSRTVIPYFICIGTNQTGGIGGGIFGNIYTIVFEHLNSKLNVICSQELKTDPVIELVKKEFDAFSVTFINEFDYSTVQTAIVIYFSEIAWAGPPQREVYAWAKVIFPMISNITALLGAAFFVLAVVLKLIHRVQPCKDKKRNPQIFWNTLAIFLGQQANYESSSLLMNVLFLLWIWFCLVVSLIYQGELVRGLQTQHLEPRFGTLENAIQSLDGYGGSSLIHGFLEELPEQDNFETIPYATAMSYIPEIANGKRYLVSTDKLRMKGYSTLQFLDKSVVRLPMAMIMRPRWAAAAEVSTLILRSLESGFFPKLLLDVEMDLKKQIVQSSSQWTVVSLDLVTLSTCFYGLVIMYSVCFVVFCIEIFYYWLLTPSLKGVFKGQNLNKSHLS